MLTLVLPDWQTITNGDISSDIFTPYGRVVPYTLSNPTEFIDRVAEADVILCNKTILDENLIPILYTNGGYSPSNECYKKIGYYQVGRIFNIQK